MPILILGVIVVVSLLAYIFVTEHRDKFVRHKDRTPPPNDPFNVIYLPDDLEAVKAAAKNKKQNTSTPEDKNN